MMKKVVVEGEAQMLRIDAATIDVNRKWIDAHWTATVVLTPTIQRRSASRMAYAQKIGWRAWMLLEA